MIETDLIEYIDVIYPEYRDEYFIDSNKESIEQAETFFTNLTEVSDNREKYNLHWAFEEAVTSFKKVSKKISEKTVIHSENQETAIAQMSENINKEIKRASRQYSMLSRITLFLDIFISVILILAVTLIAQFVERSLESVIYSILFITFIALVKVSLDRFVIIPRIDKWGWNRYRKLTDNIVTKFIRMLALKLVLKEAYKQQQPLIVINDLLNRSPIEIYTSRRIFNPFSGNRIIPNYVFTNNSNLAISNLNEE